MQSVFSVSYEVIAVTHGTPKNRLGNGTANRHLSIKTK